MALWDNCPLLDARRETCVRLVRTAAGGTGYGGAEDAWTEDEEFDAVITAGRSDEAVRGGELSGGTVYAVLTAREVRLVRNELIRRADGSVLRITDPGHDAPESARLDLRLVMAEAWRAAV